MSERVKKSIVPHSAEAEESLIACALLDGIETLAAAQASGVDERAFYSPGNRIMWERIRELARHGVVIDATTLAGDLRSMGLLDAVGGLPELNAITNRVPTTAHRAYYLETVHALRVRRAMMLEVGKLQEAIAMPAANFDELRGLLLEPLARMHDLTTRRSTETDEAILTAAIAEADSWAAGKPPEQPADRMLIGCGLKTFDEHFLRLEPGQLIVLAARPSQGKSSMAREFERAALSAGGSVASFSLEMDRGMWWRSLAATQAGVNLRGLGEEPFDRLRELAAALRRLRELAGRRHHVFDGSHTPEEIRVRVRQAAQATPKGKLDLIVVDYQQFVTLPKTNRYNRDEALGDVAKECKQMAKDERCPVVLVSALNRESERENRPPRLSDLRASGETEYHADRVIFLHKPATNHNGVSQGPDANRWEMHLIQSKFRNGPLAYHRIDFQRTTTGFYDAPGSTKVSQEVQRKKDQGKGKRGGGEDDD